MSIAYETLQFGKLYNVEERQVVKPTDLQRLINIASKTADVSSISRKSLNFSKKQLFQLDLNVRPMLEPIE